MEVRHAEPLRHSRLWTTLLGLCLLACDAPELPRTEIVVVVDTDLALGDEVDTLRIEATGPDETLQSASAELGASTKLPQTLGLVRESGALGPIRVLAVGLLGEEEIIRREAELSFIADKTLTLPMHLVRACQARACGAGETCSEHGCIASSVDATRLADWRGHAPTLAEPDELPPPAEDAGGAFDGSAGPLDAGESASVSDGDAGVQEDARIMDADSEYEAGDADEGGRDSGAFDTDAAASEGGSMCMPEVESCNELDDDCDGVVDNGYDLMIDTRHCGVCNKRCAQPTAICCKGVCSRNCAK
jgi:hypothetical protein